MSKKKIILIICLIAVVIASAITAVFFIKQDNDKTLRTPIPTSIDISSSSIASAALSDSPVKKDSLTESDTSKEVSLYSNSYRLVTYSSDTTYITDAGLTASVQKINEYFDLNTDELVYTVVIDKELSTTYNKDGIIVRSSSDYSPETDYDTENVTWFYKDGTVSCGEMSFYDTNGNFGTAYYSGDGSLICVVTEIYSTDKSGEPSVEYTYYDSNFELTTEEIFSSMLPETDVDRFLYVNWN